MQVIWLINKSVKKIRKNFSISYFIMIKKLLWLSKLISNIKTFIWKIIPNDKWCFIKTIMLPKIPQYSCYRTNLILFCLVLIMPVYFNKMYLNDCMTNDCKWFQMSWGNYKMYQSKPGLQLPRPKKCTSEPSMGMSL